MSTFDPTNPIVDILVGDDEEPPWLVPEMFLQGNLICLGGEPGAGKSYVSYTIGLAIAAGCKALSGIVPNGEPRRVLYFDDENSQADRNKYLKRSWTALMQGVSDEKRLTYLERLQDNFWPVHYHLGGDDWPERVEEWIDFMNANDTPPHVMVFDTAASCFDIQDENNNAEASKCIKVLRHLMGMGDPVITALVLKHAKIRSDRGRRTLRGAKAWIGMADSVMFQVKAAGRPRKDGLSLTRLEPDKTRAFGLSQPIYITPSYTDEARSGLQLDASFHASKEHTQRIREEESDLEDAD
jgi:hypothetical protein